MPSNVIPSEATIQKALGEFEITVDSNQVWQIQEYMRLLLVWNEKINLTAIREPLDILYRHFCESMFATKLISMDNGRLADIGTGGGFPGLPIKILLPHAHMFLVESNVKKATFLAEVVRALHLPNVNVLVSRYEELGEEIAPIDYLCARAVGDFGEFLAWARGESVAAQQVVLWLGVADIKTVENQPGWEWAESAVVPQSLRRVILVGSKTTP